MLKRRMKNKGFTLIELLVVVAILAVLMAILLPSLGRAREQAKTIKCLANLKGLSGVMTIYATEDNNRIIPITTNDYTTATANGTKTFYTNLLTDNKNANISGHYLPDTGWAYTGGSAGAWGDIRTGIWLCPSVTVVGPWGGYGVNRSNMCKPAVDSSGNPIMRPRLSSLEAPQDYWYIGDAMEGSSSANPDKTGMNIAYFTTYGLSNPQPSSRHQNRTRVNIAYVDGHAETENWAGKQANQTWKNHLLYVDNYH